MSYMLQHLHNGYQVDQAILSEEDRVVVGFSIKVEFWQPITTITCVEIVLLESMDFCE